MTRRRELAWASVSAAALALGVSACSSDDTTGGGGGPNADAATTDAYSSGDVTVNPGVDSSAPDAGDAAAHDGGWADAAPHDGGVVDGTTGDGASADSGAHDGGGADGTTGDGSTDSGSDGASPDAGPATLALCSVFDSKFMLNETNANASTAEEDRTSAYGYIIYSNFVNATSAYVGVDCSFSGFGDAVGNSTDMGYAYGNQVGQWVQQFIGCPLATDAGALTYGLIPPEIPQTTHVYTKADLDKLSSDFVDAIINTISCAGDCINGANTLADGGTLANVPPLTNDQLASIRAELARLQAQVTPPVADSGTYSFAVSPNCDPGNCQAICTAPADAGTSDASGD